MDTGLRNIQHKMKFRAVMMTPEVATALLTKNHPQNRKPKDGKINLFSREMINGFWQLVPSPICIDEDGLLIDGQNRLHAVVLSECIVPMILCTGVPRQAILGMDQGINRSVADMAKLLGKNLPHGSIQFASVARRMFGGNRQKFYLSVQESLNFIDLHRKALEFAFECTPQNKRGITQAGVRAVLARAYYRRNERNRIREFGMILLSGLPENPKNDNAVILLRNWLISLLGSGRIKSGIQPGPHIIYAKTERALEAFIRKESLEKLQASNVELFPIPDDPTKEEELNEIVPNNKGVA